MSEEAGRVQARARADRVRQRESQRKCRWCDKPGPYFGRCADHWDTDEETQRIREQLGARPGAAERLETEVAWAEPEREREQPPCACPGCTGGHVPQDCPPTCPGCRNGQHGRWRRHQHYRAGNERRRLTIARYWNDKDDG